MKNVSPAHTWAAFGASAILVAASLATATPAMASTITVTNEQELVDAINASNLNPDADTIVLSGSGFALTDSLPMVTSELTITGPGSSAFTLDAANSDLSDYNITNDVINAQMVPADGPAYVLTMRGFTISNTGYIGIYVDGPSVNFDDIVISEGVGPEACGLELRNLSGTVTNSAFHAGCGESTVSAYGQEVVAISGTEFSNIDTDGFAADLSGDAILTLDNVASNFNGGAGLYFDAGGNATVDVVSGAMNENAGNGIKLDGYESAQVRFDGVDVVNNSGSGILLDIYDSPQVTLTDIEVTGNAALGVELIAADDASASIVGGLVDGSGASGIDLDTYNSAHVGLDGVEVSDNAGQGVELNGVEQTTTTIANVTAARNGNADDYNYGLLLAINDNAAVSVTDTSVIENGYGGVYVESGGQSVTELRGIAATNNGGTQVETYVFDGAALSLDGIVATGTEWAGVSISSESTIPVVANRIVSSGNSPGLALITYEPESAINVSAANVSGSRSAEGILIYGNGAVSMAASEVVSNAVGGIFIQSEASPVKISDSTISDNGAAGEDHDFGGIVVFGDDADVSIDRSTISGNIATAGAGIRSFLGEVQDPSVVKITSSTISGNTAERSGAILLENGATGMISHTTIADNTSKDGGPAVELEESNSVISHTIIADNREGTDLFAEPATTINYSLIGQVEKDSPVLTALQNGAGNLVGISAKLGPLANNGAMTLTHLPLAGSPAIDSGNPKITAAPALDQRDAKRIVRVIDIGAVEIAATAPGGGAPNVLANTGAVGTPSLAISGLVALLVIGAGSMLVGKRRGLKL